jgi:hypothetical protein
MADLMLMARMHGLRQGQATNDTAVCVFKAVSLNWQTTSFLDEVKPDTLPSEILDLTIGTPKGSVRLALIQHKEIRRQIDLAQATIVMGLAAKKLRDAVSPLAEDYEDLQLRKKLFHKALNEYIDGK